MNIRTALLTKLDKATSSELKSIIEDGIESKEETILPGLGVLFEIYYQDLDTSKQEALLQHISKLLG